jgi:hypothetical protein
MDRWTGDPASELEGQISINEPIGTTHVQLVLPIRVLLQAGEFSCLSDAMEFENSCQQACVLSSQTCIAGPYESQSSSSSAANCEPCRTPIPNKAANV